MSRLVFGIVHYAQTKKLRIRTAAVQSLRLNPPHPLSNRIDFSCNTWLIVGVEDGHTAKTKHSFRKKLLAGIIAFFLVVIAWLFWQISAYNNAVLMARQAGFWWKCETSVSLIRKDWRNALKKETWGTHARSLQMNNITDLDDYREMLRHLRPNGLFLNGRNELKNVDALEITNNLNNLHLYNCTRLQNVDGLKNHTSLTSLMLYDCTSRQNVDGLKDLACLKGLDLGGCSELKNLDSLKKLTSLTYISLEACHKIPAADLRELHAALPKTKIVFPDGTNNPPQ